MTEKDNARIEQRKCENMEIRRLKIIIEEKQRRADKMIEALVQKLAAAEKEILRLKAARGYKNG